MGNKMNNEGVVTTNLLGKIVFGGTKVLITVLSISAMPSYQSYSDDIYKLSCTPQEHSNPRGI